MPSSSRYSGSKQCLKWLCFCCFRRPRLTLFVTSGTNPQFRQRKKAQKTLILLDGVHVHFKRFLRLFSDQSIMKCDKIPGFLRTAKLLYCLTSRVKSNFRQGPQEVMLFGRYTCQSVSGLFAQYAVQLCLISSKCYCALVPFEQSH